MSPSADRQREREYLLDRLHSLRTIVPVFAQELASARRQAARLRVENGRLLAEVRRLQRQRSVQTGIRGLKPSSQTRPDTEKAPDASSTHPATIGANDVQYADQMARLG